MTESDTKKIILALDYSDQKEANNLISKIPPDSCRLKVGKEMFTHFGPAFVEKLVKQGFEVFLDLKFHDIPNTVAAACDAAADLGVWMLNVHTFGGRRMMEAARERLETSAQRPLLIGVTVLTSMDRSDLEEIGCHGEPEDYVKRLASLAKRSGLDGVVCSAREAGVLRERLDDDFLLVTPGVRPKSSASDDQKRTMTPSDALAAGANYLVVGRPITRAPDPASALEAIRKEIGEIG